MKQNSGENLNQPPAVLNRPPPHLLSYSQPSMVVPNMPWDKA